MLFSRVLCFSLCLFGACHQKEEIKEPTIPTNYLPLYSFQSWFSKAGDHKVSPQTIVAIDPKTLSQLKVLEFFSNNGMGILKNSDYRLPPGDPTFCLLEKLEGSFTAANTTQEAYLANLCNQAPSPSEDSPQRAVFLLIAEKQTPLHLVLLYGDYYSFAVKVDSDLDGLEELLLVARELQSTSAFLFGISPQELKVSQSFSAVYTERRYPTPLPPGRRAGQKQQDEQHYKELFFRPGAAPVFRELTKVAPLGR